jgi:hypothetical protein
MPAMLHGLDHEDKAVRMAVVSVLLLGDLRAGEALPALRKALKSRDADVRREAVRILNSLGGTVAREETDAFEGETARWPDDPALRLLLLGYYLQDSTDVERARTGRERHIQWLVEHALEPGKHGLPYCYHEPCSDAEVVERVKQLWLHHLQGGENDAMILGSAAEFFTVRNNRLSEALYRKAEALEPQNPQWPRHLAHVYHLQSHRQTGEARREILARAFAELERAFRLESADLMRRYIVPRLAVAAFDAEEWEKARAYATEALQGARQTDDLYHRDAEAVFFGNLVLGRLALQAGDMAKAKEHLLESGRTTGSPVLSSYGPSMTLAKELLERGERDVVVEFLKLCTRFWNAQDHLPEQWIDAIERGEMPDFGPNLR